MQIVLSAVIFLASVASARDFVLYDDANYGGAAHIEARNNDAACCMSCLSSDMEILIIKDIIRNLNGKGDRASSVGGDAGCTTFFRERDCRGSNWQQRGSAPTVPSFLNDHIWSFRNQC
ncbi:hypothetical protein NOF04DRAFT_22474 [Fusarium oxysporum II5]|uniref:Killer toxin Kp4 domain-containing protein n=2 Tax=Fusarium oxysporum species complex TaxID=171631 RepID=X0J1J3_FUSO5|nr:uncharacterized protein FOIG_16613 [Fusarium odoratissimum NRRL 54006]EXL90125.1 hypothetical protein FOIG_16613 [Fusarium odoratissimum NRRL 54006]KAK2132178.1 hypothetical protein NOF04DRAFT_22474 [Fusarium oxysporum II5]TXC10147.1 hypothetical protein FocTR4_00006114 [Fusarium oxysporum f. sp. cubense]